MSHDANTFPEDTLSIETPAETKAAQAAVVAADRADYAGAETAVRTAYRRLAGFPKGTSLSPSTAEGAASGTVAVTVTGDNFDAGSVVEVGGVAVTTSVTNGTTLVATVPKIVGPATSLIVVSNSGGRKSDPLTFTWS